MIDTYLRDRNNDLEQYDFLWASPPCQTHSHMQVFTRHNKHRQPIPRLDQIHGLIFWLLRNYKKTFVVENVIPSYGVIDLRPWNVYNVILDRHLFYSNFIIRKKDFASRGSLGHGKIHGLMRMNVEQLLDYHHLPDDFAQKIVGLQESGHDPGKTLRNMCNYELGEYILSEYMKNKNNLLELLSLD